MVRKGALLRSVGNGKSFFRRLHFDHRCVTLDLQWPYCVAETSAHTGAIKPDLSSGDTAISEEHAAHSWPARPRWEIQHLHRGNEQSDLTT